MEESKNSQLMYLTIVAIVAIVGIIAIYMVSLQKVSVSPISHGINQVPSAGVRMSSAPLSSTEIVNGSVVSQSGDIAGMPIGTSCNRIRQMANQEFDEGYPDLGQGYLDLYGSSGCIGNIGGSSGRALRISCWWTPGGAYVCAQAY